MEPLLEDLRELLSRIFLSLDEVASSGRSLLLSFFEPAAEAELFCFLLLFFSLAALAPFVPLGGCEVELDRMPRVGGPKPSSSFPNKSPFSDFFWANRALRVSPSFSALSPIMGNSKFPGKSSSPLEGDRKTGAFASRAAAPSDTTGVWLDANCNKTLKSSSSSNSRSAKCTESMFGSRVPLPFLGRRAGGRAGVSPSSKSGKARSRGDAKMSLKFNMGVLEL
mmetsp:Transcript_14532/g.30010  ORF Transcript_14532/g.30010 Transcript_14532/m.30010 type:complete len:223 (+) Transcript_14532:1393-2061(+)